MNKNLKLIICLSVVLFPLFGFSQTISVKELSECLKSNCDDDSLLLDKGFKTKYAGPRKSEGTVALYHHATAKEYFFIWKNQAGELTQFNYYLSSKKLYDTFIQQKAENLTVNPLGKVLYDDGKYYYHASIIVVKPIDTVQ